MWTHSNTYQKLAPHIKKDMMDAAALIGCDMLPYYFFFYNARWVCFALSARLYMCVGVRKKDELTYINTRLDMSENWMEKN